MSVAIGVFLPTTIQGPDHLVLDDVRASARFAEERGLESVWSTDHLVASSPMLDSTVVLATAAAVTERIGVGYGVLLLALRPVAWAAKQISTLQHLSGNRLLLGIGTGNPAHGDVGWRAAGVSFSDRGARTDEALRVLPALVTGQPATLEDGLEVTLAPGGPLPAVLIGGNGSKAYRRAAAFGDGWMGIGLAPEDVAASVKELAAQAERHDRPTPQVTVVAPPLSREPKEAVAQLTAYAEAGTQRVILAPTGSGWKADYEYAAQVAAHT